MFPPVIPRREFDSLGLTAGADVTVVGPVLLRRKTGLYAVKQWVVHAVLDPEDRERTGYEIGD